jgi:hypothetical protein
MATLLTVRINFGTKQKPDYKPITIKINDQLQTAQAIKKQKETNESM